MEESNRSDPDDQRLQKERANHSFELVIDVAPETQAGWRSLRRALRFSKADASWLRARVPGSVRRGAESDLQRLLARVQKTGHLGRVVRRE